MVSKPRKLKVGRDSVVMGDVTGEVGDGSVVIGATDENESTILNTPMAVGRGAFAGPDSIAIGAGAGAGSGAQLPFLVNQLSDAVAATGDDAIVARFNDLIAELSGENGQPNKQKATSIMEQLRNAGALNGALALMEKVQELINVIL